jgi:hypothetical protein
MSLRPLAITVAVLVASWATLASATLFPGPDGFGYSGTTIPFNFRDISATGTVAFPEGEDDAVTGAIAIGFNFSFYGNLFSNVFISSNGFVTFTPTQNAGCCEGGPLPGSGVDNMIAGWWTDLITSESVAGPILSQTLGVAGSQEFVVEYLNTTYFPGVGSNTFEIILHQGSNVIELQYSNTTPNGLVRTVGIQNSDQTIGLQIINDNTTTFSQQGFCLSTDLTACPSTSVPLPASLALLGIGFAALVVVRHRRTEGGRSARGARRAPLA